MLVLTPLENETVALHDALGRVLAADVVAGCDVPAFDRANYDGFALRAADTYGATEESPRRMQLVGETIMTAVVSQVVIQPAMACGIVTGAMLPRGADSVLMIEDADCDDGIVLVRRAVTPGFGVAYAGTDISARETVLRRGERLTSRETGVLAAIGQAEVQVVRRPCVGILSTGDEIIAPGEPIAPGLVYDSNARILADAVRELGALPQVLGIVRDDPSRLRAIVAAALDEYDVVILSGGTSKGAGDISYDVVRDLARPGVIAHGVALKPGKPVCLAAHHGRPVVVLPGFPTSAIFTFHEFLAPVIRQLAGVGADDLRRLPARLAVEVDAEKGRTEYLLVSLMPSEDGQLQKESYVAYPMGKGSGSVTTFSRADGFVTIDRHQEFLEAGAVVSVQLLAPQLRIADLVVIGSHCLGLDYLLGQLQARGWQTKFLAVGSAGGLAAVERGECDIAGVHLLDEKTGQYNSPFLPPKCELWTGYRRRQGVVFRPGDCRFEAKNVSDAITEALSDRECVMVNRNRGSGTRVIIDKLLQNAQPPGYAHQVRNHSAVAAAIAQSRADWGVAMQTAAEQAELAFTPITDESYDFVVPTSRADRLPVLAFRNLLKEPGIRDALRQVGCFFQ